MTGSKDKSNESLNEQNDAKSPIDDVENSEELNQSNHLENSEPVNQSQEEQPSSEQVAATTENSEAVSEDENTSGAELTETATPSNSPRKNRFSLTAILWAVVVLFFLVIIAALISGAYFAKKAEEQLSAEIQQLEKANAQNLQLVEQLKTEVAGHKNALSEKVEAQVQKLEKEFSNLNSQTQESLKQQQQNIAAQNKNLQQMGQRLDGQQKRLLTLSSTNREDWLLAEAEYLMRLASQRVLIERSPHNAIALLEAADNIILQVSNGLGDPELFGIRDAIAREVTALKLVAAIDREGIYLKIQALVDQIEKLPRLPTTGLGKSKFNEPSIADSSSSAAQQTQGTVDQPSWWQKVWQEIKATVGSIDNYIRLEERDAPIKPLVDQYAAQMSGLNVRLLLQQAQIAILKEQGDLYTQSLQEAAELVSSYYTPSDESKEFQNTLMELSQYNVAPKLPDVSQSLKLLNGYIREIHLIDDSDGAAQ